MREDRKELLLLLVPLGLTVASVLLSKRRGGTMDPAGPEDVIELGDGTSTEPIAVGSQAQVGELLREYGDYLASQGVNLEWFSPEELTLLHRDRVYAIPPRHLWDEMARTLVTTAQPIRAELGAPLRIYNGYRPRSYNERVNGAKNSLHIRNAAVDLIPYDSGKRSELARIAARFFVGNADALNIGMGIYNFPHMTGLHVDAGVRSRPVAYASTKKWIAAVSAPGGVA